MVSAAVGFQCPECVREGAKSVRAARTLFGGSVRSGSPVTWTLMGLCIGVFVLQQLGGTVFELRFEMLGYLAWGSGHIGVAAGEPYRLLTAAFLHADLRTLHLPLNMYALYLFGPPLEAAFGRARYLAVYLLSAIGGSAASYAFAPPSAASIGASGAIFGLFGATLVVNRRLAQDNTALWVLLAINVAFGFAVTGIDWRAHFGGLLTGAALTAILAYAPRKATVQIAAMTGVAVVIAVVITVRTVQIRENYADLDGLTRLPTALVVPSVENSCGETTPV